MAIKVFISKDKKQFKANLHCHSTISDGKLTPEELKEAYKNAGYQVLAITDHCYPYPHNDMTDDDFLMLTGYEAYIRPNKKAKSDRYLPEVHLNLFARDKESAAELSRQFSEHCAVKEYLAVVEGEAFGGELCDFIYKDSRLSKAFIVDRKRNGVKEARLEYTPLQRIENEKGVYTLVRVRLLTGRFHQIRAQFASRGTPLVGDGKYGSRDKGAKMPSLFAFHLGFSLKSRGYDIYKYPSCEEYPWCLFDKSNFQQN